MKISDVNKTMGGRLQKGIGLIEVLIALLVLAVGILGLVGMQLNAKRAGFEATQRSVATSLARDILERMRSNPTQLDVYAAAATNLDVDAYTGTAGTDCTATAGCTPAELAAWDMWDWIKMIQGDRTRLSGNPVGGLLNPVLCLYNDSGQVTVVIAWRGANEIDQTALDDPSGLGLGECGDGKFDATGASANTDGLRRQLTMTTFITAV